MMDLVVSGATGRMGRTLGQRIRETEGIRALGGIAPDRPAEGAEAIGYPVIVDVADAAALIGRADAVIDFSAPEQLSALLATATDALTGKALLVGTTGLPASLVDALDAVAGTAAVLVASNFSVGVNVLTALVERVAGTLTERYDIEIVEAHHRGKEDAPSGTALTLGEAAARGRGVAALDAVRRDGRSGRPGPRPEDEIGFHAVRGGGVAGEHTVRFLGDDEELTLTHRAGSRVLFADGALVAARWLVGRDPGRYTMADVLGLT